MKEAHGAGQEFPLIRSMTGFGEASANVDGAHYFLEIRSLNSKYFKAVIRLPEEFQALEAELETELRHKLQRGSVFMSVKYTDVSGDAAFTINHLALAKYVEQIKRAPQAASGEIKLDIGALVNLPGVLQPPEDEEARLHKARDVLMKLAEKGCDKLIGMREREGAMLRADLLANQQLIAERLDLIRERAPAVMNEYEKRLKARIQQMIKDMGVAVQPVDVIREIAVAAERSDTAEELARLGGHIEQFTQLISESNYKPVGRTLDFLTQEMLREANTIASKCADAEISRWTVEIKGAIDRLKEQVQNVE